MKENPSEKEWQEIGDAFLSIVELPQSARQTALTAIADERIRAEVEKLLKAADAEQSFLDSSPISAVQTDEALPKMPERIGSYKILEQIGRGGMGAVYLAEREDLKKKVALKIIKRGMDTDEIIRRFQTERLILANLEHANIARLLDGGVSADGLPFLVMEYVAGKDLLDFCAENDLSLGERLALFRKICAAVSYAHQNLVVHRDLKPSNILVTDAGEPKLLDFGISKLLTNEADETGTATSLGMMTPNYASPEQFRGETVSTATDIYSLGVILFELLTGELPYKIRHKRFEEAARIIAETEPARPSSAISNSKFQIPDSERNGYKFQNAELESENQKLKTKNQNLSTNPKSAILNPKSLKGDLDNILLKALKKEAARRYATVEQFSEDIRRHLEGLPVSARPDTFSYRASKFVKRNKIAVTSAVLVFLALVGGVIGTSWQAVRAERQRALSEKRFNEVRQIANKIVFKYHDAIADLQGATEVRRMLVEDALNYLDNLAKDAGGDDSLQRELAQAYLRIATVQGGTYQANLGDSAAAAESYQKAIELLEPLAQNTSDWSLLAELRDVYIDSSRTFFRVGRSEQANANQQKSVDLSEKIVRLAPENLEQKIFLARSYVYLADTFAEGDAKKSETYQTSLKIAEEVLQTKPDDETGLRLLATVTHRIQLDLSLKAEKEKKAGNSEQARKFYSEALPFAVRSAETQDKVWRLKPENTRYQRNAAGGKLNVGKLLRETGDAEKAFALEKEAEKLLLPIAEKDPQNNEIKLDLKETYEDLALTLIKMNKFAAATENFRKAVAYNEEMLKTDPENYEFWIARLRGEQIYADAFAEQGRKDLALPIYKKLLVKIETDAPKKFADRFAELKQQVSKSVEMN